MKCQKCKKSLDGGKKKYRHYVLCGDATNIEDVERLMNGEKADIVAIIDPPYGIDVVNKTVGGAKAFGSDGASNIVKANEYSAIIGDDTTDTARQAYNTLVALGVDKFVIWGGNYFTDFLPPSKGWIVWDKKERDWDDNFSDFEMAWTSFDVPAKIIRHTWMGMVQKGEREKRVHPTQKPAQMIAKVIEMFSEEGDTIIDLFGGSGSTLIACEQLGRRCFMSELDPKYCDVIVERWENLTGKKAKLITVN